MMPEMQKKYLEKKGAVASLTSDWKRRFFVLCSKQEQRGDAVRVQFVLRYFKSEEQAVDLASVVFKRYCDEVGLAYS